MKTLRFLFIILSVVSALIVMVVQPGCKKEEQDSNRTIPHDISFMIQAEVDNFHINYPNCTSIEGNVFIGNGKFYNLYGLSNITSIGGTLTIHGTTNLISLSGLDNLNFIGGDIIIDDNDNLSSLMALGSLTSIGGDLIIGSLEWGWYDNDSIGNSDLTSLEGLNNVISIGGGVEIEGNKVLTSLSGLDNLISIGGNLSVTGNTELSSLLGLNSLETLSGDLTIGELLPIAPWGDCGNPTLTSLTALASLTSIGGRIWIEGNGSLNQLTGLDNIYAGSIDNLYIVENSSLSTCSIQSICDYLASPFATVEIHDNAPGCNSKAEVQAACDAFSSRRPKITDISNLQIGVYARKVVVEKGVQVGKIIKW